VPGVVRTVVGYAGGTLENPTYRNLGDHAECLQVEFDPAVVSYEELLDLFWKSHNPCARSLRRQYMSAIFAHDEDQLRRARAARDREQARLGKKIHTEIALLRRFYPAEDYHQKYYLRNDPELFEAWRRAEGGGETEFVRSTLAARLNGIAGGNGGLELLEEELRRSNVEEDRRRAVLQAARRR
jgi:methionine-S-sulfoxide reductase